MVLGFGLRGYGLGFRVQGLGLIGLRVSGAKLRALRERERERRVWVFPPFSRDPRTTHPQPQHLSPNPNPKNEVPAPNSETQVLNHKLKQLGFQGFFGNTRRDGGMEELYEMLSRFPRASIWGFPKLGIPFWSFGVSIIRIIAFWGLYSILGSPSFGKLLYLSNTPAGLAFRELVFVLCVVSAGWVSPKTSSDLRRLASGRGALVMMIGALPGLGRRAFACWGSVGRVAV